MSNSIDTIYAVIRNDGIEEHIFAAYPWKEVAETRANQENWHIGKFALSGDFYVREYKAVNE